MANTINVSIKTGAITLTFTDEYDEVFASCRVNPTDVNMANRCEEIAEFFNNKSSKPSTIKDIVEENKEIEDKINYLLGYNAHNDLFSTIPATTILEDGSLFAEMVLDKIISVIKPELVKRKNKMKARMDKYTAKYHK